MCISYIGHQFISNTLKLFNSIDFDIIPFYWKFFYTRIPILLKSRKPSLETDMISSFVIQIQNLFEGQNTSALENLELEVYLELHFSLHLHSMSAYTLLCQK